jgi:triacylglycerol lipase
VNLSGSPYCKSARAAVVSGINVQTTLFSGRRVSTVIRVTLVSLLAALLLCAKIDAADHVVVLHGLARSAASMETMAQALEEHGFSVDNIDYDSRSAGVHELAESVVGRAVETDAAVNAAHVHFVTHSMGGILVRDFLANHRVENLGRVVMLGPPNQGSEVVDNLREWEIFKWINGPAGSELGTDEESVPLTLGDVDFPLGIIAGDRSINWINSMMIPGPDDGKVSVENTRVEGGVDHLVVHATHPLIMNHDEVIRQTIRFLEMGSFEHEGQEKRDNGATE